MCTNFREKYKLLCNHYHKKYDEKECWRYYSNLKQYGVRKIDRAFAKAIDTLRRFPSIPDLERIIDNLLPYWFDENLEVVKPTEEEVRFMERILSEIG